jgi:SAM-dependent methyltransferase
MGELDHLSRNIAVWTAAAPRYARSASEQWARDEPTWGVWGIPESSVRLLPDVDGADVLELGCGTAYVSAWLARLGAKPIGVDPTPAQLETARRMMGEHDVHFPLLRAAGEQLPLADASFDLVVSEYGAAIWADPYRWVPEAARVLRPGGKLVFLANSTLWVLCEPEDEDESIGDRLLRPQAGMHRHDWDQDDPPAVTFHLLHGDWIRLLRSNGFEVEDLVELYPTDDAPVRAGNTPHEWARKWPAEEGWIARRST